MALKPSDYAARPAEILPSSNAALTVEYAPRRMRMVTLTETEVDDLASSSGSIHLSFLGISMGGLIAFGISLLTVEIPDPRKYAMFVALTTVAAGATMYFGANATRDYVSRQRRLRRIKSGLI